MSREENKDTLNTERKGDCEDETVQTTGMVDQPAGDPAT